MMPPSMAGSVFIVAVSTMITGTLYQTPTISVAHFSQACFSVGHGVMQQWQLLSTLEVPFNWLDKLNFWLCRASFPPGTLVGI
jgi:hypothetical protein